MDIIEFYKGVLTSMGLVVDEKGRVFWSGNIVDTPCQPEEKGKPPRNLVLPTKEILKSPDWTHQIAFHPISENIARRDSTIFKYIQRIVNLEISSSTGYTMGRLINYCADRDAQSKMNYKQTKFLQLFPDADATSVEAWDKIESKIGKDNSYISIITLRDKKYQGETYPRITTVKFNFYNEIKALLEDKHNAKNNTVFGVKLRKKDIRGFKALFEFLFPHVAENPEYYSNGSRNLVAPSFHSLMVSFVRLKEDMNNVLNLLKDETHPLNWAKELSDLTKYKGVIPALEGNEGDLVEEAKRQQESVRPVNNLTPAVAPIKPAVMQPQVAAPIAPIAQPTVAPLPVQPTQVEANVVRTVKAGGREIPVVSQNPTQQVNPYAPQFNNPYANAPIMPPQGGRTPTPNQGYGYVQQPVYPQGQNVPMGYQPPMPPRMGYGPMVNNGFAGYAPVSSGWGMQYQQPGYNPGLTQPYMR